MKFKIGDIVRFNERGTWSPNLNGLLAKIYSTPTMPNSFFILREIERYEILPIISNEEYFTLADLSDFEKVLLGVV